MKMEGTIGTKMRHLEHQKNVYKQYRFVCLDNGDHHGVQDASSDLREIEAQLEILRWVLE